METTVRRTAVIVEIVRLQFRVAAACCRAVSEGRHLRTVLAEDTVITTKLGTLDFDRLFDPHNYVGAAVAMVDRVLAARQHSRD